METSSKLNHKKDKGSSLTGKIDYDFIFSSIPTIHWGAYAYIRELKTEPLHSVMIDNDDESAPFLFSYMVDWELNHPDRETILEYILNIPGFDINTEGEDGFTILCSAIINKVTLSEWCLLLNKGANTYSEYN